MGSSSLLLQSWSEGAGTASDTLAPSIFVVGDRKQSIYGFRDAEASLLGEAAEFVDTLRPEGQTREAITVSFRADPALLAFVNRLFDDIAKASGTFRYDDRDRFPLAEPVLEEEPDGPFSSSGPTPSRQPQAAWPTKWCACSNPGRWFAIARPAFTARPGRPTSACSSGQGKPPGIRAGAGTPRHSGLRVQGLGFFDADEVQDAMALLRFLADPTSNIRAASLLRSRIVRLSDSAVRRLAPAGARGCRR